MNIETIERDDRQVQVIAEFDTETFERYKRQAARKISSETRIAGFRPGKAPYDMVRRMVGDKAIQDEAVNLMLEVEYPKIIQEADVNPYGPGKLDEILGIDPPKFSFLIPLMPTIELGSYREIRQEFVEPVADEVKVTRFIERLRRRAGTATPVERKAEVGDLVAIKLSARLLEPAEHEEAALIEENNYEMIAGSPEDHTDDQGNEWPFPGFVNELVGLGAGESKTVQHTFSDVGDSDDLSGKTAEFTLEVESVKRLELPELNDEFASTMGVYESFDAFKQDVEKRLLQSEKERYTKEYFDELVGKLIDAAQVVYPPSMLDEEIEHTLTHLEDDLGRQQMDLDTYLKTRSMSREELIEKEIKPVSERRIKRQLVMEEFATKENIVFQQHELEMVYDMAMNQARNDASLRNLRKGKTNTRQLADTLARSTINEIYSQRMLTRLRTIATGKADEDEIATETDAVSDTTTDNTAVEPLEAEGETVVQTEAVDQLDTQPVEKQDEKTATDTH